MNAAHVQCALRNLTALGALAFLAFASSSSAASWTQYRGSNHDGTSTETLRLNWAEEPPKVLWKVALPPALSSLTIKDGRVYTMGWRRVNNQRREFCLALDGKTGQELWATQIDTASYPDGGVDRSNGPDGLPALDDDGPRSTPSVDGDRVYAFGSYMNLVCLEAATGREIWKRELVREYGSEVIAWQNAASPLVVGDLVLVNGNGRPGEHLLAFRKTDGTLAWKTGSDRMTHATPVRAMIGGVEQVIFYAQTGMVAVRPESGAVLWRYPVSYNGTSSAASPVVSGDVVYVSRAYPTRSGAVAARIENQGGTFTATRYWERANAIMNHWATPVYFEGNYYGIYGQGSLTLRAVDGATGATKWQQPGFGYGSVTLVKDKLFVLGDTGTLYLVETNPDAYTELARIEPLYGRCWNNPAVSDGIVYIRSSVEAVAIDLSTAKPPAAPLTLAMSQTGGQYRLEIASTDGSAIDGARAAGISLFSTPALAGPGAAWTRVTNSPVISSGRLLLESAPGPEPRLYFRTEEAR